MIPCDFDTFYQSRRTFQNKVRINVVPVQLTKFISAFVAFKNALFNNFLPYRHLNCSEILAFTHFSYE